MRHESMLTRESLAVAKDAIATSDDSTPLTDRVDQCFAGSIITHGRGRGRMIATASDTQLGKIAQGVTGKTSAEPPLMIRIRKFTYQVAFGMTRMAKRNVIIRKLVAVEALGSCTLICSDKTGTLTINELTIRKVNLPDGRQFDVTGEGVAPGGEITDHAGAQVDTGPDTLRELCIAGVLANESHLDYSGGEWVSQGDIVDIAFLVMAKKLGMSFTDLRTRQEQVTLIPYESEKAYSGVVNRVGDQTVIYARGSPEKMLAMCNRMATADGSTDIDKPALESQFTELASRGYRIIALAKKTSSSGDHEMADMIFLGMVAMIDPLRHEAFDAIEKCRTGGIEVAMVTFFFCVLAGLPMPMIAVQLLWLNLVANGFQDVALAFEPKEGGELSVKPRSPQEPVFDKHIIEHVLVVGSWMGLVAFLNFQWTLDQGQSIEEARNLTLMLMVLFGNIHALNSRSESRSLFSIPLLGNPFLMLAVPLAQLAHIGAMYTPVLSDVLQIQPISVKEWLQLLAFAMSLLAVEELHKILIRRRQAG